MTGTLPDGSPVGYIGPTHDGLAMGDQGKLLTTAGRGAHVMWSTGARAGQVTLVDGGDLVPVSAPQVAVTASGPSDGLDDSLDVGYPASLGLGHLCALRGPGAVLTAIASSRPADLASIPSEVWAFAEQRVAATQTIQHAASQLDEEDTAELVRLATAALLQDTFGLSDG